MAGCYARAVETFALGTLSGLIVGVIVGWFGHILAGRRSKADRKVFDQTAQIDRCGEVFSARVRYVIAFHKQVPACAEIREDYHDLQRQYRWADPEVFLAGTPAWDQYMTAELGAMRDKDTVTVGQRVKSIEAASIMVVDALAKRRGTARN